MYITNGDIFFVLYHVHTVNILLKHIFIRIKWCLSKWSSSSLNINQEWDLYSSHIQINDWLLDWLIDYRMKSRIKRLIFRTWVFTDEPFISRRFPHLQENIAEKFWKGGKLGNGKGHSLVSWQQSRWNHDN